MAAQFLTLKTCHLISRLGKIGFQRSFRLFSAPNNARYLLTNNYNFVQRGTSISRLKNNYCPTKSFSSGNQSGKIYIEFTCKKCNTRNQKFMSKVAYNSGVVIITCDGCKNNHLIADNLNWFTDLNGKKNIEDILREKGESVRKISVTKEGVSEIVEELKSIE